MLRELTDTNLLECVRKINTISSEQLSGVLNEIRITPTDDHMDYEALAVKLLLKAHHLKILITVLSRFFKSLSEIVIKPTDLQNYLIKDLCLDQNHSTAFVKLWSEQFNEQFGILKGQKYLRSVAWSVNVETMSQQTSAPCAKVTVRLGLSDIVKNSEQLVDLECNEEQLRKLYECFENIQSRIDLLN